MSMPASSSDINKPRQVLHHDEIDRSRGIASSALKLAAIPLRPIRPLLPHLLPFAVCLLCVPLLMFLSGAAGLAVWKNVPVGWMVEAYLQYGDTVNPFAVVQLPPIFANQPYDVSLHLVLPATEANYALGNFMTTLRLTTAYNESIITVRRSTALVPPCNSLLKQVILGSSPLIILDIPLLTQFVTGNTNVIVYLELGRPDAWKSIGNGQRREVSVVEAKLTGTVRPTGIRAILARYPRLATFISTFTFFFVSIIVVTGFLFSALAGDSPTHPPPVNEDGSDSGDDEHDNTYPKARPVTRRRYQDRENESDSSANDEHKTDVKSEDNYPPSGLRLRTSVGHTLSADVRGRPSPIKIETDDAGLRRSLNSSAYPKSAFPNSTSAMDTEAVSPQDPLLKVDLSAIREC